MATTTKETKAKETSVTFIHRENNFFLFTEGKMRCQFVNGEYTTSNKREIEALTSYMYNRGDLLTKRA